MKKLKYTLPETKRHITIRKLREDLVYDANQYKKYSRLLREGRSDGKILTESQIHGQFINEIKKSIDVGLTEGILDTGWDAIKRAGAEIKKQYDISKKNGDEAAAKRWAEKGKKLKATAAASAAKVDGTSAKSPESASDGNPPPVSSDTKKSTSSTTAADKSASSTSTDSKSASPATKLEDTKLTPEQATKAGAAVINLLPKEEQEKLKKMSPEQIGEFVKKNSAKLDTAGEKIADKISDTTVTSDNPKAKGFFGKMMTWAKENPMKATAALALITAIGGAAAIGSGGLAPLIVHTLAASAIGAAKGGAVGALGGAAVDLYKQKTDPANTGKAIDWKRTGKAALSGAKSGAIGGGAMGGLTAVGGAAMQGVSGLMGHAANAGTAVASAAPGATSVADRALHAAGKGALRGAGMAGLGAGARDVYKQAKDPNSKGIDLRQTARAAGRGAVVGAVGGGLAGGAMSLAGDLSAGVRNLFTRGTGTVTSDELHKASQIAVDPNSPNHAQETALTHDAAIKAKSLDSIGLKTGGDVSNRADGGFDVTEKRTGYKYHFTKDGVPTDDAGMKIQHQQTHTGETNTTINQQSPVTQDVKEKIFSKLGPVPNDNEIRQQPNGIVGVRDSHGTTKYFYKATGDSITNASEFERARAIDRFNNPDIDDQGRRDWLQKHGMVQPTTQPTTPQQSSMARQPAFVPANNGQPHSFVPNPQQTHAGEMAQAAQTTPVQQSPVAPPTDAAHMNVVDKLDARNAMRARMALTPDETAAAQAAAQPAQNPVDVPTAADTQYAADQQAAAQYDASGNPVQQAPTAQPAFVPANNGQPQSFVPNPQQTHAGEMAQAANVAPVPQVTTTNQSVQNLPIGSDKAFNYPEAIAKHGDMNTQYSNAIKTDPAKFSEFLDAQGQAPNGKTPQWKYWRDMTDSALSKSGQQATPTQPAFVPANNGQQQSFVPNPQQSAPPAQQTPGGAQPAVAGPAQSRRVAPWATDVAKGMDAMRGNAAALASEESIKTDAADSYKNYFDGKDGMAAANPAEFNKWLTSNPQFMRSPQNPTGLYNLKPVPVLKETKLFTRSTSIPNMFRLS